MSPTFRLIVVFPAILIASLSQPLAAADNDLAGAYRVIASKRFVDLTHSFDPRSPVWSGFGQAKMTPAADPKTQRPYTIKEDGFRTTLYEFVGQYGTHVDPPAHFDADGITMDQIPLEQMILPLVVFDETPMLASDPNHALSVADIEAWEQKHGRVPEGAFAALFARGFTPALLIGADSPALPPAHLRAALSLAASHPEAVVLGPAEDGGYWCVGLSRPARRLFDAIAWSTPSVRAETEARAVRLGLAVIHAPTWHDVDEPEDLARLRADLRDDPDAAPRTRAVLAALTTQR